MKDELHNLIIVVRKAIQAATQLNMLDQIRIQYFGKKSHFASLLKQISTLPPEKRIEVGQYANTAKKVLLETLQERMTLLQHLAFEKELHDSRLDITLPGRLPQKIGSLHPVTHMLQEMLQLFLSAGFTIMEGPEIEEDYYNFEALNFPTDHPARAMHDTFYFENSMLLRTHTSPVQIRAMQKHRPPLRIITPGCVYRRDADQTHTPMFHQIEGLFVDTSCTFAHLKGFLQDFLKNLFGQALISRFRPSYFPFTEPSAEMDIGCVMCETKGCRVCKQSGWLEILGCGMVHPNVLQNCGIDAEEYTGFAFGLGVDRLAMLRYGIDDLRQFFQNDIRFLEQFT